MDIIYNEYSLLFYYKNLTQKFIHSFILYSIFHTQTNIETQVAHKYIQLHEYSSTRLLFYLKRVNWQVAIVSVSGKKSSKTNERRRNAKKKKTLDNTVSRDRYMRLTSQFRTWSMINESFITSWLFSWLLVLRKVGKKNGPRRSRSSKENYIILQRLIMLDI